MQTRLRLRQARSLIRLKLRSSAQSQGQRWKAKCKAEAEAEAEAENRISEQVGVWEVSVENAEKHLFTHILVLQPSKYGREQLLNS